VGGEGGGVGGVGGGVWGGGEGGGGGGVGRDLKNKRGGSKQKKGYLSIRLIRGTALITKEKTLSKKLWGKKSV